MRKSLKRLFRKYQKLIVAAAAFGAGVGISQHYEHIGSLLLYGAASLLTLTVIWGVYQDRRIGAYSPDILPVIGIIALLILREPILAMAAIVITVLRKYIAQAASDRAGKELRAIIDQAPHAARILRGRKEIEVLAAQVQPGQKLLVHAGEIIPVDSTDKQGEHYLSGSLAKTSLILRASADMEHSQHQKFIRLARSAVRSSSPFIRLAERYAPAFMVLSLIAASASWYITGDVRRFAAVLLVAAPTPLLLGASTAFLAGLSSATRRNIYFRTGSALERFAQTRTLYSSMLLKLPRNRLAIERLSPGQSTADKIIRLEQARERPVAYLSGDVEDTPVFTAADIGIALGAAASSETADIIIASDKPALVSIGHSHARRTLHIAVLTVGMGIVISMVLQLVFITAILSLTWAIILQLVVDGAVLIIGLQAGRLSNSKKA